MNLEKMNTGLIEINEALDGGLKPGKVYIVAGRSAVGKSAFVQTIVHYRSLVNNDCIIYYASKNGMRHMKRHS